MKIELYWGKLTWGLFHTIAEKINDENELMNIKNLIVSVCSNLPCPYCRDHAKTYLSKKPINKLVRTKDELKKYFFHFHNVVNLRTKKPIYSVKILEQYASVNFNSLLNNWMKFFKIFRITPYDLREHSDREKTKQQVYNYLVSIKHKFKDVEEPRFS